MVETYLRTILMFIKYLYYNIIFIITIIIRVRIFYISNSVFLRVEDYKLYKVRA